MNETIHEAGRVSGDRVEIGTSSVFSRLIQEAGRWCESYASDLLVDIDCVRRVLGTEPCRWREIVGDAVTDTEEGYAVSFRFGFRRSGVDHAEWIDSNMDDSNRKYHYYRSIWRLSLTTAGEQVTMDLTRLS